MFFFNRKNLSWCLQCWSFYKKFFFSFFLFSPPTEGWQIAEQYFHWINCALTGLTINLLKTGIIITRLFNRRCRISPWLRHQHNPHLMGLTWTCVWLHSVQNCYCRHKDLTVVWRQWDYQSLNFICSWFCAHVWEIVSQVLTFVLDWLHMWRLCMCVCVCVCVSLSGRASHQVSWCINDIVNECVCALQQLVGLLVPSPSCLYVTQTIGRPPSNAAGPGLP